MGSYEDLLRWKKENSSVTSDVRQNVNKQEMLEMANDFDINALIKQYLTDGVLTDKERQVILKKAEKMGLDRDEVDLYLDAEVQKLDMETDAAVRRQKGKQCPYCGAPIPQLADKCPECGQYITPEATKELEEILDNLEEALVNMKSQEDFDRNKAIVERYERKARMYYSNHPKIKVLLSEVDAEMDIAEKRVKSLKRSAAFVSFLKNPWIYAGIAIIITVCVIVYFVNIIKTAEGEDGQMGGALGLMVIGGGCIIATVSIINTFCLKKK